MKIEIIYENDTELAEYEAYWKEYRTDVIVCIDGKKYKVFVVSMVRLQQDFEAEQQSLGHYISIPNTIIVNEVTKKETEDVIHKMCKSGFFKSLDNFGF